MSKIWTEQKYGRNEIMINCNILPPHKFPTFTRRHVSYRIFTTHAIFLVKIHTQKNIINHIHQLVNVFQLNKILVWFHPLDYTNISIPLNVFWIHIMFFLKISIYHGKTFYYNASVLIQPISVLKNKVHLICSKVHIINICNYKYTHTWKRSRQ